MILKEYLVEWTIELNAESPEDAARQALAIQRDPESTANVFICFADSKAVRIDLDALEDYDDLVQNNVPCNEREVTESLRTNSYEQEAIERDQDVEADADEGGNDMRIPCSLCGQPTSFDPIYGDLCYRCIRADNE